MKILLCGSGQYFIYFVKTLLSKGHHLTVICPDENECTILARETEAATIWGDPTDEELFPEVGADHHEALITMMANDAENHVIAQLALKKYHIPKVMAMVNNPENETAFQKMGVKVTLSIPRMVSDFFEKEIC